MRILSFFIFASIFVTVFAAQAQTNPDADPIAIFEKTTDIVTKRFYDQTFRGLNWPALVAEARTKITSRSSEEELKSVLNGLLFRLHASHTEFLSNTDQEFWALKSVFSGQIDGAPLYQIGAWFAHVGSKWFIRSVFEDSPADHAGLKEGDEVLAVEGQPLREVNAFVPSKDHPSMVISFKHRAHGSIKKVTVTPIFESFQRTMLRASLRSTRILTVGGRRIGYFHLWAGTNDAFKDALKQVTAQFATSTDAMILDLRDGFGGASPEYLNPFFSKDDEGHAIPQIYAKPLASIINGGVRSGKEWLAYIIKTEKRGFLVGTQTKGYFLGGQYNEIVPGKYVLYLAVEESSDLPHLEGNGVRPDIEIKQKLPFNAGRDRQLKAAIDILGKN